MDADDGRENNIAIVDRARSSYGANCCIIGFEADGCEKQRAQYPKRWNDVSKEKTLFNCAASNGGRLSVRLGASDRSGRSLISVTATPNDVAEDKPKGVYRIWLDRNQTERIKKADYFATVVPVGEILLDPKPRRGN